MNAYQYGFRSVAEQRNVMSDGWAVTPCEDKGEVFFLVFRSYNDRSGRREYFNAIFTTAAAAQAQADRLNYQSASARH